MIICQLEYKDGHLVVWAPPSLAGDKLTGLCGNYDGDASNDRGNTAEHQLQSDKVGGVCCCTVRTRACLVTNGLAIEVCK